MIRDKENSLFEDWEKHLKNVTEQDVDSLFCPDGLHTTGKPDYAENGVWIMSPDRKEYDLWTNSPIRCLFLSKDYNCGNDGEGMDLREETGLINFSNKLTRFHKSYFMMYYGFMNCNAKDGTYPSFEKATECNIISSFFYHNPVVRMNIKKLAGGGYCQKAKLQEAINRDKSFISRQIDLYNANILVCLDGAEKSPIMKFLFEKYRDVSRICYHNEEYNFLYYSSDSKIIIIHEYHPMYFKIGEHVKYLAVRQLARFLHENPDAIDL